MWSRDTLLRRSQPLWGSRQWHQRWLLFPIQASAIGVMSSIGLLAMIWLVFNCSVVATASSGDRLGRCKSTPVQPALRPGSAGFTGSGASTALALSAF